MANSSGVVSLTAIVGASSVSVSARTDHSEPTQNRQVPTTSSIPHSLLKGFEYVQAGAIVAMLPPVAALSNLTLGMPTMGMNSFFASAALAGGLLA